MSLDIIAEHKSPTDTMDQVGFHDHKEVVGSEINHDPHVEDDPHRAAIDDNPEKPAKLTSATILAVFVRTKPAREGSCITRRQLTSTLVLGHVTSSTHLKRVPHCNFYPGPDRHGPRRHD